MLHFIAIHKFHNDAARKTYCSDNGEPISQKAWAEFANNTKEIHSFPTRRSSDLGRASCRERVEDRKSTRLKSVV